MFAALTTTESIDLALAVSTFLLSLATVVMARFVKDQAEETRKLAEIGQRQLDASTIPVVRIMRDGSASRADIATTNEGSRDEHLSVRIENRGAAPAEIEKCLMDPGGEGELVDADLTSPTLEPNGEWDVAFHPSAEDKEAHRGGRRVRIEIRYLAIGSGSRYRLRTWVKREGDDPRGGDRWSIVNEEQPYQLGEPFDDSLAIGETYGGRRIIRRG